MTYGEDVKRDEARVAEERDDAGSEEAASRTKVSRIRFETEMSGHAQERQHVDEDVSRSFVRERRRQKSPHATLRKVVPRNRKVVLQEAEPRGVAEPSCELVAVVPGGVDGEVQGDQAADDPHGRYRVETVSPCRACPLRPTPAVASAVGRSPAHRPAKVWPGSPRDRRRGEGARSNRSPRRRRLVESPSQAETGRRRSGCGCRTVRRRERGETWSARRERCREASGGAGGLEEGGRDGGRSRDAC
jgi:hypothetical protein